MEHLQASHPISLNQWGFQRKKSTVLSLLATTHDWLEALEAEGEVCTIFFDLRKAFDTLPSGPAPQAQTVEHQSYSD